MCSQAMSLLPCISRGEMAAVWINMTNGCLVGSSGQVSWTARGDVGSRHLIVSDKLVA